MAIERIIIVGGGVGGLLAALGFARDGHRVELLERDPLPDVADVEAAFDADRRGASQVHQTHGFLARIVVELRERFPDVLDQLLVAGCVTMPTTAQLGDPRPGDEDDAHPLPQVEGPTRAELLDALGLTTEDPVPTTATTEIAS